MLKIRMGNRRMGSRGKLLLVGRNLNDMDRYDP